MAKESTSFLKVSTEWIELEIISEPDVVLTFKGYVPILQVREIRTDIEYRFYISAKSLAEPLEELRSNNGGIFKGIQFRVCKEGTDKMAKYEVDTSDSTHEKLKLSKDMTKRLEEILSN